MSTAFADSDCGDTFDSQLTLGTGSLLSIFFGLVLVCGIFFGLGFSFGRRGLAQMAAQMASQMTRQSAPRQAAVSTRNTTPAAAPPRPVPPRPFPSTIAPSQPLLTAQLQAAPMLKSAPLPVMTAPLHAPLHAMPSATARQLDPISTAIATPPALRPYIPKPSAIHAVVVQPHTTVPYSTATAEWKWTPPFDVHPHGWHQKATAMHEAHFGVAHPAQIVAASYGVSAAHGAAVVQIAALSRQDDAQVLTDSLRKRGFIASIQNGAEDTLYHVQVGPLERHVALQTQQRLLARGYNAVVK